MSIVEEQIKIILDERRAISPNNEVAVEEKQNELFEALGNDEDDVIEFLNSCCIDDLIYISEVFEDIYSKFPSDKMWDALEVLEHKSHNN
ncbi:MAG: hypothetical protein J1E81_00980 [Eubacterium sp.]|nr:hypothetical protein [Eubacterium sp.]